MSTRRNFLSTGAAATAGAAALPSGMLFGSTAPTNNTMPVTQTYQVSHSLLLKHLHRITTNPKHNPYRSGDLTSLARFHFGAMETSGQNTVITDAARKSGVRPLTADHVQTILSVLATKGINFPSNGKALLLDTIPRMSAAITPKVNSEFQMHSILKLQRSIHGELHKLTLHSNGAAALSAFNGHTAAAPHLLRTAFAPPRLRLVGQDNSGDESSYEGDTGWADTSSDSSQEANYETTYDTSGDNYDPAYASYLGSFLNAPTYTTPSGTTLSMCQIFYGIASLGLGGWAALIGAYGDAALPAILAISSNPALAITFLTLLSLYAAYLAFAC